jgi:asparagine synthase (glutamine-hydrolysing)
MCGIAGVYLHGQPGAVVDEAVVREMQRRMLHRGPDAGGWFARESFAMCMRRLAIIDRAGGDQPIHSEDGSVSVVYNGEIYNHHELRRELEAKGHRFRSRTDTEVIVHLYEEEGVECVKRLDGMFAFSLWDEKRRRLLLARDRFGVKPLYYAERDGRIAWSSEIHSLLADPSISAEIDWEAMEIYLALYYIPSPWTVYRAIQSLKPAHYMVVEPDRAKTVRYWSPRYGGCALSAADACEMIRWRLEAAVKSTLESEVPLGVFLSGGLDSTAIAGFAKASLGSLRTYSLGFDGAPTYDERPLARSVAEQYGTDHLEITIRPDEVPPILEKLAGVYGQPFGDWSAVVNYRIAAEAKKTSTVILRGDGGDELFGGYPTLVASRFAGACLAIPAPARALFRRAVDALPASESYMSLDFKLKRFAAGLRDPIECAHLGWKEIFDARTRETLVPALRDRKRGDVFDRLARPLLAEIDGGDLIDRMMYLDLRVFLEGCGLITSDHVAMSHTIETRVPFLTNELADFAFSLPAWMKVRGTTTKYIFRRAMKPILPRRVLRAPKRGFVIPGAAWMRGPMRDFMEETLLESPAWIDRRAFREIWDGHLTRRTDATRQLTALVNLTLWSRGAPASTT